MTILKKISVKRSPDAIVMYTKSSGINEAIQKALENDHSIYEVSISLFDRTLRTRTPISITTRVVASNCEKNAELLGIELVRNQLLPEDACSPENDLKVAYDGTKLIIASEDIRRIKSAVNKLDGIKVAGFIKNFTGINCDYQENRVWDIAEGKIAVKVNQDEMTAIIVKTMCEIQGASKPGVNSIAKTMKYFDMGFYSLDTNNASNMESQPKQDNNIFDKNGLQLEPGQTLRIKHCVGAYGQTDTVEGILISTDKYNGATVELTKPAIHRGRDFNTRKNIGEKLYVSLPVVHKDGKIICDKHHNDFEHGHHAWVEVIAQPSLDNQESLNESGDDSSPSWS